MYEHRGDNQLALVHASRALELFQTLSLFHPGYASRI
jgi:hypothetical protein